MIDVGFIILAFAIGALFGAFVAGAAYRRGEYDSRLCNGSDTGGVRRISRWAPVVGVESERQEGGLCRPESEDSKQGPEIPGQEITTGR